MDEDSGFRAPPLLALSRGMFFAGARDADVSGRARAATRRVRGGWKMAMNARIVMPPARLMVPLLFAATVLAGPAAAQTAIKFALDGRLDGPSAPFAVALDKAYYKGQGLDVSLESVPGPIEAITRVASGAAELGFADINAMIKFRDQNPNSPLKAVFMIYNRPPFAI